MNYALVFLVLGIIVKFVYENVPDNVYVKLGKSLKVLFLLFMIASVGCGAGSITLSFVQPVSADSNVGDTSVYEQQIATLQVQLEDCRTQLDAVNATLEILQNDNDEQEVEVAIEENVNKESVEKEKQEDDTKTVKVLSDVYLRSKANSSSKVKCVLKKGTKLVVTDSKGSWLKVKHKGTTGYVSKKFCEDL